MFRTSSREIEALLFALHEAVQAQALAAQKPVTDLMEALWDSRFVFRAEPWHTAPGSEFSADPLPQEMLLSLQGRHKPIHSPTQALHCLYDAGLHIAVDHFLAGAALVAARDHALPCVSINLSLRSLLALPQPEGRALRDILGSIAPYRTVFEILEREDGESGINQPEAHCTLVALKEMGYRLALDDLTTAEEDLERLQTLGPYADFLKIDGGLIEKWHKGDEAELAYLLMAINILKEKRLCNPSARLVAEWVRSEREAAALAQLGIHAVQGRDLLAADFQPAARAPSSSATSRGFAPRVAMAASQAAPLPPAAAPGLY